MFSNDDSRDGGLTDNGQGTENGGFTTSTQSSITDEDLNNFFAFDDTEANHGTEKDELTSDKTNTDITVQASGMVDAAAKNKERREKVNELVQSDDGQNVIEGELVTEGPDDSAEIFEAMMNNPEIPESMKKLLRDTKDIGDASVKTWDYCSDRNELGGDHHIVENMIPDGGAVFMNGNSGVGKTFLMCALCHAISTGSTFAGRKVEQRPCFILELEGKKNFNRKMIAFEEHYGKPVNGGLKLSNDTVIKPGTKEGLAALCRVIAENFQRGGKPPVLVIDTLAQALQGDACKLSDAGAFLQCLNKLHDVFGVTTITLSHYGKDEARGIAGSSRFQNDAETVLNIQKGELPNTIVMKSGADGKARFEWEHNLQFNMTPYKLVFDDPEEPDYDTMMIDYENVTPVEMSGSQENEEAKPVNLSEYQSYVYAVVMLLNKGNQPATKDSIGDMLENFRDKAGKVFDKTQKSRILKNLDSLLLDRILSAEKVGNSLYYRANNSVAVTMK